jgi:hypothetical protein
MALDTPMMRVHHVVRVVRARLQHETRLVTRVRHKLRT